jgi:hypothetical protein
MEGLAILFGVIAGGCLAIIGLRCQFKSKLPLFGAILSKELPLPIDKADKILAITALVSFLIFLFFVVNTY